jgi:hypothetical protein
MNKICPWNVFGFAADICDLLLLLLLALWFGISAR